MSEHCDCDDHHIEHPFLKSLKVLFIPQIKGDMRVTAANAAGKFHPPETCHEVENEYEIEINANDQDSVLDENSMKKDVFDKEYDTCEDPEKCENTSVYTPPKPKKKKTFKKFLRGLFGETEEEILEDKLEEEDEPELEDDGSKITSPLDVLIGHAVTVTGTITTFFIVMIILIAWVIWGAVTGAPDTWQIVMQDGQSIQTYVWDTFLVRQQLDDNEKFLMTYGRLKSRAITHSKLLNKIVENDTILKEDKELIEAEAENEDVIVHEMEEKIHFKSPNLFDKFSDIVSKILGSLPAVIVYWAGIFVWIGCGAMEINNGTKKDPQMEKFSNTWQMYINTAVAIELLFTSVFLENVRSRSTDFILEQSNLFNKIDRDLELMERELTGFYDCNEMVVVKRCPRDREQNWISFYANVIGNGLGLIISTCVFITWFGIGDLMHWSANWWLVIGTYTGLIGFIDGFVLREIFYEITNYEQDKFRSLLEESQALLDLVGIEAELKQFQKKKTIMAKASIVINDWCSTKWAVLFSVIVVIGLIIMACAMLWSETAQLICNTPTMIIEGFFLLILIQAQDWASEERSHMLKELYKSRVLLYNYVRTVKK